MQMYSYMSAITFSHNFLIKELSMRDCPHIKNSKTATWLVFVREKPLIYKDWKFYDTRTCFSLNNMVLVGGLAVKLKLSNSQLQSYCLLEFFWAGEHNHSFYDYKLMMDQLSNSLKILVPPTLEAT